MKLDDARQTIEVAANVGQIEAARTKFSTTPDSHTVTDIPLAGRDLRQLVFLIPGGVCDNFLGTVGSSQVEKKIRRHLARARQRRGFGWKRRSKAWLYETLGLFSQYRVTYQATDSAVVPA